MRYAGAAAHWGTRARRHAGIVHFQEWFSAGMFALITITQQLEIGGGRSFTLQMHNCVRIQDSGTTRPH